MKRAFISLVLGLFVISTHAAPTMLEAVQTGGFFADAPPSNLPEFQNYFVGYGTTPGFGRTSERRSFFWFDLSELDGPVTSASLHLTLPFGGLIFGKGPGDPSAGPLADDPFEVFQLSATPFPGGVVTMPGMPDPLADSIFASFAGPPIADPLIFGGGGLPASEIVIPLNALGLGFLNSKIGLDLVLTGFMPSWSYDSRLTPSGDLVEGSELIFGLTDVHDGDVPKPYLTFEFGEDETPVPEVMSPLINGGVAALLVAATKFRRTQKS